MRSNAAIEPGLCRVHTEGGAAMSKCEKATADQMQAKEDMINTILKLLHTSSYPHVHAILCMLQK